MTLDRLPPFNRTALLLDLDGTLIDIAPTPDTVVVPPGLTAVLARLRDRLQDALAVVTGRPIETIDTLLGDAPYAVAGEHGGARRHAPRLPIERPDLPSPPTAWFESAAALAAAHRGALLEPKARGFALHYRLAPDAGPDFGSALSAWLLGDDRFELMAGQMTWEVRPKGVDKGSAVDALMHEPPFRGRIPLFIGDDVTDEDGMRAARALGGAGLRVDAAFGSPAGVRAWLTAAAQTGDWPELPGGPLGGPLGGTA